MESGSKLLLSNIPKQFRIVTTSQEEVVQAKRVDFILDSLDADYPKIKRFLFQALDPKYPYNLQDQESRKKRSSLLALRLDAVEEVNWSKGLIQIKDHDAIQFIDVEDTAREVLLIRDILDAYVIDLQNRRLRRANDLLLGECPGLCLMAVDTGVRAILRRLSRGYYKGYLEDELQDWKYIEFLRGDPGHVKAGSAYHRRIANMPPGGIANLAEGLPSLHAAELILLLPHELAAHTLERMSLERQLQVFEELDESYALSVLEKLAPDTAADLIGWLAPDQARQLLVRLPELYRERIIDLLRYPAKSVGGIMTNDVIAMPGTLTISEARERLRTELQEPDFVYFLYVVDSDEDMHLRGVVTLRSILVAKDDQRLEEIMNPYLEVLAPLDSPHQAAYRLINSQLAALPVVGAENRLLGAVTVDAAVNLVAPETWSSQAPRIFS